MAMEHQRPHPPYALVRSGEETMKKSSNVEVSDRVRDSIADGTREGEGLPRMQREVIALQSGQRGFIHSGKQICLRDTILTLCMDIGGKNGPQNDY